MKYIMLSLILFVVVVMASSCASISRGSYQDIMVQPYNYDTGEIITTNCDLNNDDGNYYGRSNGYIRVHRDKDMLCAVCENNEYIGNGSVDGKIDLIYIFANAFIDYCTISGIIDGFSGAWSSYPSVIRVPMKLCTENNYILYGKNNQFDKLGLIAVCFQSQFFLFYKNYHPLLNSIVLSSNFYFILVKCGVSISFIILSKAFFATLAFTLNHSFLILFSINKDCISNSTFLQSLVNLV